MDTQLPGSARISPRYALKRLFLSFALLLAVLDAPAKCYYVRPSGNDNNTGLSVSLAWKTITRVNSQTLAPGDSVLFEGGQTFQGNIVLAAGDGNDPVNPVLISSYGNTPATIDAGNGRGVYLFNTEGFIISRFVIKGSGKQINAEYGVYLYTDILPPNRPKNIRLENLEIYGFGKTGITVGAWNGNAGFSDVTIQDVKVHDVLYNGITSYGYSSQSHVGWSHTNFIVRRCEVYNVTGFADASLHKGSGIILGQVDGGLIEHSVAYNNGSANIACGGPGGIWAYDCNSLVIQYCESHHNSAGTGCDGLGFDLDGGMTNSIIQYCYSHDNDGAGILLGQYANARAWKNNIVRFNISVNDGRTNSGGITLFKGEGTVMKSVDIYHNTVYFSKPDKNTGGAFTITEWYTGIDSVRVLNNILQTSGGAPVVWIPAGYHAQMLGNQYWSGTSAFKVWENNQEYNSLSDWRDATGQEHLGNITTGIQSDPLLVNAGQASVTWPASPTSLADYKPLAGSPVINAAIAHTAIAISPGNTDFFASAFPSGPKADIGAGEFYFAPGLPGVINTETATLASAVTPVTNTAAPVTTGIVYNASEDFVVYPNPLPRGRKLTLNGVPPGEEVEIFTTGGDVVARFTGDVLESTNFLQPGFYIVRLRNKASTGTQKLLVR